MLRELANLVLIYLVMKEIRHATSEQWKLNYSWLLREGICTKPWEYTIKKRS